MGKQARYNASSVYTGPTSGEGGTTGRLPSSSYSKPLVPSATTYVSLASPGSTPVTHIDSVIPSTPWSQTTALEPTSLSEVFPSPFSTSHSSDVTTTLHVSFPISVATSLLADTSSASGVLPTAWPIWPSESPAHTETFPTTSWLIDTPSAPRILPTAWSTLLSESPSHIETSPSTSWLKDTFSPSEALPTTWSTWLSESPASTSLITPQLPDPLGGEHQYSHSTDTPSSTRDLQTTGWSSWFNPSPVSTLIDTASYPSAIRSISVPTTVTSQPGDWNSKSNSFISTINSQTTSSAIETPAESDISYAVSRQTTDVPTTKPSSTSQYEFPNLLADISTAFVDPSSLFSSTAPSTRDITPISSASVDLRSTEESRYLSTAATVIVHSSRSYVATTSSWSAGTEWWASRVTSSTSRYSEQTSITSTSQQTASLQSRTTSAKPTGGGGQIQAIDDAANSSTVVKKSAEISAGAVGASLCIIIGIFVWIRRIRQRGTIYVGMQQREQDASRFSFDS